jgi:hypothetical protein
MRFIAPTNARGPTSVTPLLIRWAQTVRVLTTVSSTETLAFSLFLVR